MSKALKNKSVRLYLKYHPDNLSRNLVYDDIGGACIVDISAFGDQINEYQQFIRRTYAVPNIKADTKNLTVYFSINGQQLIIGLYDIKQHQRLSSKALIGGTPATPYICDTNNECYIRVNNIISPH